MKLLELYLNRNGDHKFVAAEGTVRTEIRSAMGDNNSLLDQALAMIEGDSKFEWRVRIYDANGIMLKGAVTRYATIEELELGTATEAARGLNSVIILSRATNLRGSFTSQQTGE